jgi:hypothetical protein
LTLADLVSGAMPPRTPESLIDIGAQTPGFLADEAEWMLHSRNESIDPELRAKLEFTIIPELRRLSREEPHDEDAALGIIGNTVTLLDELSQLPVDRDALPKSHWSPYPARAYDTGLLPPRTIIFDAMYRDGQPLRYGTGLQPAPWFFAAPENAISIYVADGSLRLIGIDRGDILVTIPTTNDAQPELAVVELLASGPIPERPAGVVRIGRVAGEGAEWMLEQGEEATPIVGPFRQALAVVAVVSPHRRAVVSAKKLRDVLGINGGNSESEEPNGDHRS